MPKVLRLHVVADPVKKWRKASLVVVELAEMTKAPHVVGGPVEKRIKAYPAVEPRDLPEMMLQSLPETMAADPLELGETRSRCLAHPLPILLATTRV